MAAQKRIGDLLDAAFTASARTPDLVLNGHVHNYQRFTRTLTGTTLAYIVIGNGGYRNLHHLAKGAAAGEHVTPDVVYEFGDAKHWGFLERGRSLWLAG